MDINEILEFLKSIVYDCNSFCNQMNIVKNFIDELYKDII